MKTYRNIGAWAGLYLAASYLATIVIFLVVLNYPAISNPLDKVALIVNQPTTIYLTNIAAYVVFGLLLIGYSLALKERLTAGEPVLANYAAIVGCVWAGLLIASGLVQNAGIEQARMLYANDPSAAASYWTVIESVSNGLGGAYSEILGGTMSVLVSLAALRMRVLPRLFNFFGLALGGIGILSTVPGLQDLAALFGICQVIWFVGWSIHFFKNHS